MSTEKTIQEKNIWKNPQRRIYNKPRRKIEGKIEAVEEQITNNNLNNNEPKIHKKVSESCKTPKRKYKMNPKRINRDLEEIKEAGEEQKRGNLFEAREVINNNSINNNPKDPRKMTESWKTPKRKYEMNPRRINEVPEEIREAGEEQKKETYLKQEKMKTTG